MKMTRTQVARKALRAAEERLALAVAADYPPRTVTQYRRGSDWIPCEVLDHAAYGGDRVKVRGIKSGKEYWVYSANLVGGSDYT